MMSSRTARYEVVTQGESPSCRGTREKDDLALLDRMARGDLSAVGELYAAYGDVAYGLAWRILGDEASAENAVERAFVSVAQKTDDYAPACGTVASWLLRRVRGLALEARSRTDVVVPIERARSAARAPSSVVDAALFEGRSYEEIAERRSLPIAKVRAEASSELAYLAEQRTR